MALSSHLSINPNLVRVAFRLVVPIFIIVHGVTRMTHNEVGSFADYLSGEGIPFGGIVAWIITLFEVAGSLSLMGGFLVVPVCFIFITELLSGIAMAHAANGWFVVGGGSGGMEYSVLLIISFLMITALHLSRSPRH